MVYIVHHSADLDGAFSAVITARAFDYSGTSSGRDLLFKFVPYNYQDKLLTKDGKELVDVLEDGDYVFFVDCSYTIDKDKIRLMIDKVGDDNFVLIDHHETSIEFYHKEFPHITMSGSENSSESEEPKSAAMLCAEYFIPGSKIRSSRALRLISNYDVWYRGDGKWETETLPFQLGLRSKGYDMKNIEKSYNDFIRIVENDNLADDIISDGLILLEQIKSESKLMIKSYSRKAIVRTIDGKEYNALMAPGYLKNSALFEYGVEDPDEYKKYDLFILEKGDFLTGICIISIISNKDDIDAGKIAKLYGGGGHRQISSCRVKYKNPYYDKENDTWVVDFTEV